MDKIDLRPLLPPVRDQGARGTCVAFAVTAAHELARHFSMGTNEDLSEEVLYWKCKQVDGDQQPGTSLDSASTALKQVGQPHEDKWSYDGFRNDTDASYMPPQEALDAQFCFTATLRTIQATIDEIKSCLANNQAVVVGIPICDTFLMAPNGRVPMPSPNQAFTEGHAILVVGYEEDANQGRWLIFRNSWGDGWGDHGYGYLPCEYIETIGGEAAVVEK